ncbi:MAG TPA: transporter [Gemmatimonadaceae bacterium]|nr:transporter [Gemmatimonadaceae bacterium]
MHTCHITTHRAHERRGRSCTLLAAALLAVAAPARAQTDFYNTDVGRPLRIEDANPVERYALELQAAPLRLERAAGGEYRWELEPALSYGILPRTQLEIGVPLVAADAGVGSRSAGVAGVDVSVLHALNTETLSLPALALGASVLAPVGGLAADHAYGSLKAIATRTTSLARFHLNGEYTLGPTLRAEPDGAAPRDIGRWLAGAAVDRTFPLRSLLVGAELYARQPLADHEDVEWNAGAGLRYQVGPRWALDAGVGRQLNGPERAWHLTFGTAYAFGLQSLIPVGRGGAR